MRNLYFVAYGGFLQFRINPFPINQEAEVNMGPLVYLKVELQVIRPFAMRGGIQSFAFGFFGYTQADGQINNFVADNRHDR